MAPFFSGGGYSSEAISFVLGLEAAGVRVTIEQHGDSYSHAFASSLDVPTARTLQAAWRRPVTASQAVVVCHSEPGAWQPPRYPTSPCPPPGSLYTVGRTMFETDRLPAGWEDRINSMHEVWVPTRFHAGVFEAGGVAPHKVVVVPEPVDTDFFDPGAAVALRPPTSYNIDAASTAFKFLSVFKWEYRKGWDVLLGAFGAEFGGAADSAELYILTSSYHSSDDFADAIRGHLETVLPNAAAVAAVLRRVHLVDRVPQGDLPSVYNAVDAFVLPSRGEGWGRPHVEAMSMGLPVIATNWSGPTAFMTDANSYPLPYTGLSPIPDGAFKGHLMADPSVADLQAIMRGVVEDPAAAAAKGARARQDMVAKYSPARVAGFVAHQLARIEYELQHAQPPDVTPRRRHSDL